MLYYICIHLIVIFTVFGFVQLICLMFIMTKELVVKWKKSRTDLDDVADTDLEEQAKALENNKTTAEIDTNDDRANENLENLENLTLNRKEEKRTYHKYKRESIYKDQLRELSIDAKYELVSERGAKELVEEEKDNEKDTEESLDTEESESSNRLRKESNLYIVRV
jgi:phage-related minor tail protein